MELYQKPDRYGFNGSFNSVVAYLIMITLGVIIIAVSLIAFVYVYVHNIK